MRRGPDRQGIVSVPGLLQNSSSTSNLRRTRSLLCFTSFPKGCHCLTGCLSARTCPHIHFECHVQAHASLRYSKRPAVTCLSLIAGKRPHTFAPSVAGFSPHLQQLPSVFLSCVGSSCLDQTAAGTANVCECLPRRPCLLHSPQSCLLTKYAG